MLKTKMQTGLPVYIEDESSTSYTYNLVAQRVQRQTLSVSYFYNLKTPKFDYQGTQEGRKLKTQPSCDEKYVYDGNSNLTYKKDALESPEYVDTFTYNYQNQLTQYDLNGEGVSNTTTYTYINEFGN